MSVNPQDINRTIFVCFIVGSGGQLIHPVTYRDGAPTRDQMAAQLAAFNYTRKDEFRCYETALVVQTTTRMKDTVKFTPEEIAAIGGVRRKGSKYEKRS